LNARSHDEYRENLGAYVLGALPELEAELLDRHLETCETCRATVEELQPVMGALARSVPQVEPPPSLKANLMRVVNEEAALRSATEPDARPTRRELPMPRWLGNLRPRIAMAGALAVLALGVLIGVAADKLSQSGPGERTVAAKVNDLARGSAVLEVGKKDRTATLKLTNAPSPPAGRTYQMWIQRGNTIERGPTFTVDSKGAGSQKVPGGVRGADAVMVTVEKAGGAPAPTQQPILRFNV
jgi:anti-sigma factor RsiW